MVSLFLFLNVNPTPAQGTLSSAVDLYTFCLSFDVVFRYVHSQISLAQVSVKMMLLSIFGSSPWLPHSFCLVVAGLCHRAHPKGCCHPPGPQPVLSFLPFFPVPPGCLMHCRARCLSGQRPPSEIQSQLFGPLGPCWGNFDNLTTACVNSRHLCQLTVFSLTYLSRSGG